MKTNIFGDILDIQREMLRLITETPDMFNINQIVEDNWQPSCDIYRNENQLHIALDISGVDKESIKIKSSYHFIF
jgi:HSP20 family molecular chaperone IbpA